MSGQFPNLPHIWSLRSVAGCPKQVKDNFDLIKNFPVCVWMAWEMGQ